MHEIDTPHSKEKQIESAIESCIRACNRNLTKWNNPSGPRNNYKLIDNQEVRGLFINWFTKHMKVIISFSAVSSIMRDGKPVVTVDMNDNYITSVTLADPYGYTSHRYNTEHSLIKRVLKNLNYESLKYNPATDEPIYGYEANKMSDVSFAKLESISFF